MSGKYGSVDLVAGQNNLVCTAPAGKISTITLVVANRTSSPARIKIAVGSGVNPVLADYVYYDVYIDANDTIQSVPLVLSAGENIWVNSDVAGISVRAQGFGD